MSRRAATVVLLAAACLVAGCSRQDAAWRQAQAEGTEAAYEAYLDAYPDGLNAAAAQHRLGALREDREWSRAERLGTPESYQRYLARHPDGRRAEVARERLAVFLEPLPPRSPARPAQAAADPEAEPPAPVNGATPFAGGGRWLQLGAFVGGEAAAEAAWRRLAAEHAEALGGLERRIVRARLESGDLWRLYAGPVAAGDGEARCAVLRGRGASCLLRAEQQVMIQVTK